MSQYELGYELVLNIYDILKFMLTAWILCITAKPFMKSDKHIWLIGATYFMTILAERYMPFGMEAILAYGTAVAAAFGMMYLLDKTYASQKFFLAVTFYTICWQVEDIEGCMIKWLYAVAVHLPGYLWHYRYQFIVYIVQNILVAAAEYLLLFGATWILRKVYRYKKESLSGRELVMLLMPSVSSMLGYAIIRYYLTVYVWNAGISTLTTWGWNDVAEPLFDLFSLATVLVVIIAFTDNKTRQRKEKQQEILTRQVDNIKAHIGQVEKLYQNIRSIRHDMGNHMMTLMSLQEQGNYTQAGVYLSELRDQMQEDDLPIKSGNPVTDVILSEKKKEAEEKGIGFNSSFYYPEDTGIKAFDISVILYNALDNAIEAVSREMKKADGQDGAEGTVRISEHSRKVEKSAAWIQLTSYRKQNAYVIEAENSFHGVLIQVDENGLPLTTKVNPSGHGFGLHNIQNIAEQYYGTLDTDWTGERFRLRVLLQIPGTD